MQDTTEEIIKEFMADKIKEALDAFNKGLLDIPCDNCGVSFNQGHGMVCEEDKISKKKTNNS